MSFSGSNQKGEKRMDVKPAAAEAFGMGGKEFAADTPSLRAMPLMSGPAVMFDAPRSIMKPSLGLARPSVGLRSEGPKASVRAESFGVQKEWTGLTSASVWDVKTQDLEMLPEDFPLERTHRMIEGTDAAVVAARISEVLRAHSIETEYDCKQAKAKCKTSDYVSFRIRLYAGGVNGDPVVVEIQRRGGSASSFMHSCRAILNAAEGKDANEPMKKVMSPLPVGEMQCLREVMGVSDHVADASEGLTSVLNMLRSRQLDTNVLGMENLVSLTDLTKTNIVVAAHASKSVALGNDSGDLREELKVMVDRDVYGLKDADDTKSKHAEHLRHLALLAFANALSICVKDGSLRSHTQSVSWFSEHLMPALVEEIKRASSNACNAVSAVCCVYSLVKVSEDACQLFASYNGVELLLKANAYGMAQHEILANETARCLKVLGHDELDV